jgi:Zn-dependent M32 family carboxypeptidase
LDENIRRFHDPTISRRVWERRGEINEEQEDLASEIHAMHGTDELEEEYQEAVDALAEIENMHDEYMTTYDEYRRAYDAFIEEYNENVRNRFDVWHIAYFSPLQKHLQAKMQDVEDDLQERMPDVNEYDVPEAVEVPLDSSCLYDSDRDYIPQLATYKQFAGKFEHLVEDEEDLAS